MPVISVEDLPAALAGVRTLAGLDLGDKTRPVIMRRKFTLDAQALLAQAAKDGVGAFVMGLPVNMDGSEGPRAQASRAFVRNMQRLTELPFAYWDERLSTVAAERALIEMDVARPKRDRRIE